MGDGTVPLQSLQECKSWLAHGAAVNCKEYNLRKHSAVLKDSELITDVLVRPSLDPSLTEPADRCSPAGDRHGHQHHRRLRHAYARFYARLTCSHKLFFLTSLSDRGNLLSSAS